MDRNKAEKRMATAPVGRLMLQMGTPMILSMMLQAVYNIVDSYFVANMAENGEIAVNALTLAFPVQMMMVAVGIGTGVGANALIARALGQGDREKAGAAAGNAMTLMGIIYAVCLLFGAFGAGAYIGSQTSDPIALAMGSQYLRICCMASFGILFFSVFEKTLQATGRSLYSTIAQVAGALTNIVLDPIMIYGLLGCPKLGVAGAAWATVLTQALSAISCIVYCFAVSGEIKLTADDLHADKDMMSRCVKTGVPIAIQNGLISVSMVALQRVTNGFGETVMAAYTVSMRIEQFVQQPFSSLNAAVSTFTGQNIGAGKEKRAQKGLACAIKISVIFSAVVLVLFMLFGGAITSWFVKGKTVISISAKALIITSLFYWSLGIIHTTRGFLNGAGDTNYALVNGMAEVICRIGLSLMLTRIAFIGYWGIWYPTAATWFVTAMVSLLRYKGGKWRLHAIVK